MCLLLQNVARYQCTRYLEQLVPLALLSARIVQSVSKNHELSDVQTVPYILDRCFYYEVSKAAIPLPQAFAHPCSNQWWV